MLGLMLNQICFNRRNLILGRCAKTTCYCIAAQRVVLDHIYGGNVGAAESGAAATAAAAAAELTTPNKVMLLLLLLLATHALENHQIAWTCTVHSQIDNIFPKTHSKRNTHPNTMRRHNTCTCNQSNRMDVYCTHSNRQPHTTMGPCICRNILKHIELNCNTVTSHVFQFR
jgi:hypothetical protein